MRPLTALVLVIATLLAFARPGESRAYTLIGAAWDDYALPVPYCVNVGDIPLDATGGPIVSPDTFASMVRTAFDTWQRVPGTRIRLAYRGICTADPWDDSDGVNAVGFGIMSEDAGGGTAVNYTDGYLLRDGAMRQIVEADIVIDSRLADYLDAGYYRSTVLPHILLHEAGHFLGLDHSNAACSVMIAEGLNPTPTALCDDDVAAIRALYPAP